MENVVIVDRAIVGQVDARKADAPRDKAPVGLTADGMPAGFALRIAGAALIAPSAPNLHHPRWKSMSRSHRRKRAWNRSLAKSG